ncbi:hypothetical protein ES703_20303 [subsurface metagenome]
MGATLYETKDIFVAYGSTPLIKTGRQDKFGYLIWSCLTDKVLYTLLS